MPPYIHLALSENIAEGHYGINLNEFTAPSSSVLWPFLLVPLVSVFFSGKRSRIEKLLAGTAVVAVILHLVVGRSGWFHRYGVYMWAVLLKKVWNIDVLRCPKCEDA